MLDNTLPRIGVLVGIDLLNVIIMVATKGWESPNLSVAGLLDISFRQ